MEDVIKVDDSVLLSKRVIKAQDIIALVPEEVRKDVVGAYVYVNENIPFWLILCGAGGYTYIPHSGEMVHEPYAHMIRYGRIYLSRKARYKRSEITNGIDTHKTFAVYVCRPRHMYLWKEVREYWYSNETGPVGYSVASKLFRRFKP